MTKPKPKQIKSLIGPQGIAVVGVSQKANRANAVLRNLKSIGYEGRVYGVNPNYDRVQGYECVPSVKELPPDIECVVVSVGADAAVRVLEEAYDHDIKAAVVLAAGFGEGGKGVERAARLRSLSDAGMAICGPNCLGVLNLNDQVAAYSGIFPAEPIKGNVALITQSGGLGANALMPLMGFRRLGFSHVISCGNQVGLTIEEYLEYLVEDDRVQVLAVILESLSDPQRLLTVSARAHQRGVTIVALQTGRSARGRAMVQSHTGSLVENSDVLAAFLRRCGIVQVESYDEFVETLELFSYIPATADVGDEAVVILGSGGNAAVCADTLEDIGFSLAPLSEATNRKIAAALPAFGSVNNPIDGTGAMYEDDTLLPKLLDAVLDTPGRPVIASYVSAQGGDPRMIRFSNALAQTVTSSGRVIVAYQYNHLFGKLDVEVLSILHGAGIPLLMGTQNSMRALRYLPRRRGLRDAFLSRPQSLDGSIVETAAQPLPVDFLGVRERLVSFGADIVEAVLVDTEANAIAAFQEFGGPVVVKVEAPGLIHKSDIGGVVVNCGTDSTVVDAYNSVLNNARKAGFEPEGVLLQPMVKGTVECFIGVLHDPIFGPTVSVGIGGVFIEILDSSVTEMVPVDEGMVLDMLSRLKGAALLNGVRGQPPSDRRAFARLAAAVSQFASRHAGQFKALDLNPVMLTADGRAVAVDIVLEV